MAESNKIYTEWEQERIDAVNRYQRGERPSKICKSLGRSRSWLQKWIGRYNSLNKSSEKEWFKEESRAPKNVHRKTDSEIEQLVVNVRKSLMEGKNEDTKYRCIGAVEVQFRMHELGYSEDETPSVESCVKYRIMHSSFPRRWESSWTPNRYSNRSMRQSLHVCLKSAGGTSSVCCF